MLRNISLNVKKCKAEFIDKNWKHRCIKCNRKLKTKRKRGVCQRCWRGDAALISNDPSTWKRICPRCIESITYKTKSGYWYAIRRNSMCLKCNQERNRERALKQWASRPRHPVKICCECKTKPLGDDNKSGYCNDCYIKRSRKKSKYECPLCHQTFFLKRREGQIMIEKGGCSACKRKLRHQADMKEKCAICGIPVSKTKGKRVNNRITKKTQYVCGSKCAYDLRVQELLRRIEKEHKDRYDYSGMQLSLTSREWSTVKVSIICKKHGAFMITPRNLSIGRGCPICQVSKGERLIIEYLNKHKIVYIHQKKFFDCLGVRGGQLKFDFYVPIYNTLIEFDGQQHYRHAKIRNHVLTPQELERIRQHDKIKTDYAAAKNMPLIRIKYSKMKSVGRILKNSLGKSPLRSPTPITTPPPSLYQLVCGNDDTW